MTTANEKLEKFFDAVVDELAMKHGNYHYPRQACFADSCKKDGIVNAPPLKRPCNWKDIRNLTRRFLIEGPEVNRKWKQRARRVGLKSADFHDLCLGIFVSGDAPEHSALLRALLDNTNIAEVITKVNMDAVKTAEAALFNGVGIPTSDQTP